MKEALLLALLAGFSTSSGHAAPVDQPEVVNPVPEPAAVAVRQSARNIQQSYSGLVTQTENGLLLKTSHGEYLLKGLSLEQIIGQEVQVTGIVKNDKEVSTIYVVMANVQQ